MLSTKCVEIRGLSGAEFDWSGCSSIVPFSESQHILLSPIKEAAIPNLAGEAGGRKGN